MARPSQASYVGGPLLSPADLAARIASAVPPALLDVRWQLGGPPGIDSYLAGHLPAACFIDLDNDLSGPPGAGGRHPLPDQAVFEAALRNAGLRAGQLAVVYDDGDSTIAARLWWMLRYYGHSQVAVLDGGYRAWSAAGLPVTTVVPRPAPGDFSISAIGRMPLLDDDGAGRLARSGFLLDARAAERYRGEAEPVDRAAGHIPGAISAPTKENVTQDGKFRPAAELARRFAALGLPIFTEPAAAPGEGPPAGSGGEPLTRSGGQARAGSGGRPLVGAYCGSGVTAAHEVLALELAGVTAALYVGSWSAWCANSTRPVATGQDPG